MLKDKLYAIVSIDNPEGKVIANVQLNKDDEIFQGHFPGQPVLPGACMLQILREVLETALNKKIRLKRADQMKFLAVVDPTVNDTLQLNAAYSMTDAEIPVSATMSTASGICFKFKGIFIQAL